MIVSRRLLVAAAVAGLGMAGLAVSASVGASGVALASAPKGKAEVRGIGAVEADSIEVRIVSVDLPTRTIVVEKAGHQWRITVPEDAGSLAALRPRDRLEINRIESALVSVAPPKSAKPDIVYESASDDGLIGGLPARWVLRRVIATVTFEGLDDAKGVATYVGPEGRKSIRVIDPAVMTALKKLKKGELVTLTFTQATEFVLTPRKF